MGTQYDYEHSKVIPCNRTPSQWYTYGYYDTGGVYRFLGKFKRTCSFCGYVQFIDCLTYLKSKD